MSKAEPHRLSAAALARLIEAGELTAETVVRSCLDRIRDRDPVVRAWAWLDPEQALDAARACDKGGGRGVLKGVPFGIKDIFDTADMPTGYGSPIYTGCRPSFQASAAALPQAAGAILIGKTVTTEFANRHPGPTSHPRNPMHTPGGSSSGSAAAVADFMVPLALGTQTGGSVIRPAAYCGVVGFKPSFGLYPPAGMHPNTESLDTVGTMARSVEDTALFRAALMAIPYEPPRLPERPPRLALCRTMHWDRAEPEGRAVLEDAAARLRAAGAEIVDSELPAECADISETQRRHSAYEAPRVHAPELRRHEALLSGDLIDGKIADGRELSLDDFRTGLAPRRRGPRRGERVGRRVRRDPDPAGSGSGAEGARLDRLGGVQRAVDPALHAVPDIAGRRGAGRAAGRHPAGRTPPRRRKAARCRAVGRAQLWGHGNDAR